jgi:hypothetical protein
MQAKTYWPMPSKVAALRWLGLCKKLRKYNYDRRYLAFHYEAEFVVAQFPILKIDCRR